MKIRLGAVMAQSPVAVATVGMLQHRTQAQPQGGANRQQRQRQTDLEPKLVTFMHAIQRRGDRGTVAQVTLAHPAEAVHRPLTRR